MNVMWIIIKKIIKKTKYKSWVMDNFMNDLIGFSRVGHNHDNLRLRSTQNK